MRINRLFKTALFCVVTALSLSSIVNAQQSRFSKRQVSDTIAKLERTSDTFRRDFNKYLNQSSINGTNEEDRVNQIVSNYENALDRLRGDFDVRDNWWESRRNVREVMDQARTVNQMMNNLSFARKLENQWRNMRRDLNSLADTYDLAGLGTDSNNTGGGVPSWAIGTFYGRNPQTGGNITLTINSTGSVSVDFGGGAITYGTLYKTLLEIDGSTARISRTNDGIQTIRDDNGERINYARKFDGINNPNTGTGNPVKWAIGTWYASNPQGGGGTITMFIQSNGQVTITMPGGAVSYATMDDDRLNNGGIIARVTRLNDGIRTTRLDNGERIDYFRYNYYTNPNGNNNQQGNVPDWAVGTFYGRNPQNGGTITLTVQQNGSVTVNMDGNVSYGSMNGTTFTLNEDTAKVTKISNGFRMTNNRTGERIDYRRQ